MLTLRVHLYKQCEDFCLSDSWQVLLHMWVLYSTQSRGGGWLGGVPSYTRNIEPVQKVSILKLKKKKKFLN